MEIGTNQLIGTDFDKVQTATKEILAGNIKKGSLPEFWDGKAAERIVNIIVDKI